MAKRKGESFFTKLVILLAYFHRYGWIALTLIIMYFTDSFSPLSISCIFGLDLLRIYISLETYLLLISECLPQYHDSEHGGLG